MASRHEPWIIPSFSNPSDIPSRNWTFLRVDYNEPFFNIFNILPFFYFSTIARIFSVEKIRVWGIKLEFHPLRIKFPRLLGLCIYIQLLLVCSIISFRKRFDRNRFVQSLWKFEKSLLLEQILWSIKNIINIKNFFLKKKRSF